MTDRRTSAEWAVRWGVRVVDPDGWREASAPDFDSELIDEGEMERRLAVSTVERLPGSRWGA